MSDRQPYRKIRSCAPAKELDWLIGKRDRTGEPGEESEMGPSKNRCMDASRAAKELSDVLDRLGTRLMWDPELRAMFERRRMTVVPVGFYYPVPSMEEIEDSFEYREQHPFLLDGLFDAKLLACELDALLPYSRDFNPPEDEDKDNPTRFAWRMSIFSYSDAMAYYCMIRRHKPRRIIEVGSGFSTLIALEACKKNGFGEIFCIEPYPRDFLRRIEDVRLFEEKVQTFTPDWFNNNLEDKDFLFIDSTHAVKTGSDCVHLYLRIIPFLRARLLIHVHDIMLPDAIPRDWLVSHRVFWGEQYLLCAYLLGNRDTRIVFGSRANMVFHPEMMKTFMGGKSAPGGGSLWFELRGASV